MPAWSSGWHAFATTPIARSTQIKNGAGIHGVRNRIKRLKINQINKLIFHLLIKTRLFFEALLLALFFQYIPLHCTLLSHVFFAVHFSAVHFSFPSLSELVDWCLYGSCALERKLISIAPAEFVIYERHEGFGIPLVINSKWQKIRSFHISAVDFTEFCFYCWYSV